MIISCEIYAPGTSLLAELCTLSRTCGIGRRTVADAISQKANPEKDRRHVDVVRLASRLAAVGIQIQTEGRSLGHSHFIHGNPF